MGVLALRRADGGGVRRARPGAEAGRAAVSYENIVGLALSILLALFLAVRPAVPGEVLVSTTTAGIIFLVVLVAALVVVHVPLGDYMYRVYTSEKDLARRAGDLPADRCRFALGADVGRLRPKRVGVLVDQHPLPVRVPARAGQVAVASARSGHKDDPGAGVEHRGQLRHQYQLAGLLRRVDPGPPGADGRAGGAELRLGRRRHGSGDRAGARVRPQAHRRSGELLGRPGAHGASDPAADLRGRRRSC